MLKKRLGPVVQGSPPYRRFLNDGVDVGFVDSLVAYETGEGAVVMTNGYRGGELAQEIMNSITVEYHWRFAKLGTQACDDSPAFSEHVSRDLST